MNFISLQLIPMKFQKFKITTQSVVRHFIIYNSIYSQQLQNRSLLLFVMLEFLWPHSCSIPNIINTYKRPLKKSMTSTNAFSFAIPYLVFCFMTTTTHFFHIIIKSNERKSVQVYSINKPINSTFMTGFLARHQNIGKIHSWVIIHSYYGCFVLFFRLAVPKSPHANETWKKWKKKKGFSSSWNSC